MKVKSIFCLMFLMVGTVLVTINSANDNFVKASTDSSRTIKSDETVSFRHALTSPNFQTSCSMSDSNVKSFNFRSSSPPPSDAFFAQNNPLLISDRVAYTMVFRLLSSHKNDPTQIKRLRAYIRQNLGIKRQIDIVAVFSLASDFKRRISPLDNQINTIKDNYHAIWHPPYSQADQQRLAALRQDKEQIVDDLIAGIPLRMSIEGRNKLNQSIQDHVKARIKIHRE